MKRPRFPMPPLKDRPAVVPREVRGYEPLACYNGLVLAIRCCKGTTQFGVRYLCSLVDGERPIGEIVRAFKCERCGGPPTSVELTDDRQDGNPNTQSPFPSAGWQSRTAWTT